MMKKKIAALILTGVLTLTAVVPVFASTAGTSDSENGFGWRRTIWRTVEDGEHLNLGEHEDFFNRLVEEGLVRFERLDEFRAMWNFEGERPSREERQELFNKYVEEGFFSAERFDEFWDIWDREHPNSEALEERIESFRDRLTAGERPSRKHFGSRFNWFADSEWQPSENMEDLFDRFSEHRRFPEGFEGRRSMRGTGDETLERGSLEDMLNRFLEEGFTERFEGRNSIRNSNGQIPTRTNAVRTLGTL